MNHKRKPKKAFMNNNIIAIHKNVIKEIIIEAYKEIEEQKRIKHTPTEFLKLPLSLIFESLKVILGLLAFAFLLVPIFLISTKGFNIANCFQGAISISIAALCGLFALVFHKTGNEVEKETDKYYIVAYFSAIVSLVALVVALIGLFKVIKS
ncbi:MAG: hypothetical protein P4L69_06830 [Desulfosporosinus sp.]|nr:hypothetical protein [Desulfosporosinus sp.]